MKAFTWTNDFVKSKNKGFYLIYIETSEILDPHRNWTPF